MIRTINKINDDLIEICKYENPNVCFGTTRYPDNYDFVIFKEVINPFDLFNDNKVKDKKLKLYESIIKEAREHIHLAQTYGKRKYLYINGDDVLEILDKVERTNNDK